MGGRFHLRSSGSQLALGQVAGAESAIQSGIQSTDARPTHHARAAPAWMLPASVTCVVDTVRVRRYRELQFNDPGAYPMVVRSSMPLSVLVWLAVCLPASAAHALTVTQPAVSTKLVAGSDHATEVLGNPWDMNDVVDVVLPESGQMVDHLFSGGVYTARTTGTDPGLYLSHQGLPGTVNLARGNRSPIRTAEFRYLTLKMRVRAHSGAPLVGLQPVQWFYFRKGGSPGDPGSIGQTNFRYVAPEVWNVITFDMNVEHLAGWPTWTSFSEVAGLRLDPTVAQNAVVEIDWVRMTRPRSLATQAVTVQWSDTVAGTYSVAAVDDSGVAAVLGTGIQGTSYAADMTTLPPGQYRMRVSRAGATSTSPAVIVVNAPPVATMISPAVGGDPARDFALTVRGNAWGPFDPSDIALASNVSNLRFDDPPGSGSVAGRPTSGDHGLQFAVGPAPIDAGRFRSLCFTLQVFGPRDIGTGSVARLFWGNSSATTSTTDDIIVEEGLNEYCLEDLATVPLEPGAPTPWAGTISQFRLDPHEFPSGPGCNGTPEVCRDFRLDRIRLSPFASADPDIALQWMLSDDDDASVILGLVLDSDTIPGNGNERTIRNASTAVGAGIRQWSVPSDVAAGTYRIYAITSDGLNSVVQYAPGRLLVPAASATSNRLFVDDFEP